jgi:hypothetical protein
MSMLSLSQQYTQAGGPDELFQRLTAAVGSTRKWAHYSELLVIDRWIFLLYCILYRFRLVPRALAVFGLITIMLHFTVIPLLGFLGYSIMTVLGVPMALSHIALALWLMAKGLEERLLPHSGEAHGAELARA